MRDENEAMHIELEFPRGLRLVWQLLSHEAANIWLKCLLMNMKSPILIKNRFAGFTHSRRDELFLTTQLNQCIRTINANSDYEINQLYEIGGHQDLLNSIHHHFSVLIGRESNSSSFWQKANSKVKSAICGLNDYIHELEALKRAGEGAGAYACVEFFEAPALEIPERWNSLFSLEQSFGDMTLHYDQIGKSWLEVLIDRDESIVNEAIRPLSRLTGSFNINFFGISSDALISEITPRAQQLGLDTTNSELRLGQLKVARLLGFDSPQSQTELTQIIGETQEITEIRITRGKDVICSRFLDGNLERYFEKVEWK